jgi:hypothetical protein
MSNFLRKQLAIKSIVVSASIYNHTISGYPLMLATSRVSLVQSVLCLPRNLCSFLRRTLLSFSQSSPDGRRAMITPCCFDDDTSQVRVARLRDAASSSPLATGVLAWHSAAITHQLSSTRKAGNLA